MIGWRGSIIDSTNEAFIPRFDMTKVKKTDFLNDRSYPTFLYYNPYEDARSVKLITGEHTYDVYELTTHELLYKDISGEVDISLPADTARVVAVVPSDGERMIEGGK